MNRESLMNILPHRGSMLLLDEAELIEGEVTARYTARGDEWFFDGHFPGNPVMPGVVQCEIIAQGACLLLREGLEGKTAYYAGMDKVRFRRMVKPGDTLIVRARLLRQKLNVYVIAGEATVEGETASSGEFSFIIP